ncbi:MAG TPA: glycosyltransferase [Longimicrobiaceae bacterium]|nr:glycosyltransferase [Longimicrobiaceae bacterium]
MNSTTAAPEGVSAIEAELAAALRDAPPIVCFANDWRGDPTSKHHIMRSFSRHTDVLWVESSGMRRPQLSKATDLSRIWGRLKRSFGGLIREHERLHVLSALSVPLPGSRVANAINRELYRASIRSTVRKLGFRGEPLRWVYTPTVAPYLAKLPGRGLVYHCVDRWWSFSDYDGAVMRACHAQLCREADVVFASSAELLDDCREYTERAYLMRHGVEWGHFAKAALDAPPRPADIADVEGPILGFFGLLHEWVDQDLLCTLADAFPEATLVLIGKVQADVSRLESRRNVRLLGQRPYAELPAYSAAFDVGLIPFVINELTAAVNPIKLREYLSAGMPVVATALPEIELLRDNPMLRTARAPEEFIAGIRSFLDAGLDADARRDAALAMAGESWPGRCAEMARLLNQQLGTPLDSAC